MHTCIHRYIHVQHIWNMSFSCVQGTTLTFRSRPSMTDCWRCFASIPASTLLRCRYYANVEITACSINRLNYCTFVPCLGGSVRAPSTGTRQRGQDQASGEGSRADRWRTMVKKPILSRLTIVPRMFRSLFRIQGPAEITIRHHNKVQFLRIDER